MANSTERVIIESMMQLYVHDFSANWAGTSYGDVDDRGRFAAYPLDPYWSRADHIPWLIRQNGQLAGFCLTNVDSHIGRAIDRNVAEFFILRKYRGHGVGMTAAHALFARKPGIWEVAVETQNPQAVEFWRRTVHGCRAARDVEEVEMRSPDWNGPVLHFRISA
ncbi:GNAT family N-acetyltransferase [Sphingoaurantiacus capsulatus]|uniref:GNAT family N-acetyltransferase n=1 Tax=Sphingoaurantiacus capsulatus TaxID=1771310 RepID=A0ABV7X8S5_9SPHN